METPQEAPGMTLEQVLNRHIADLLQTGDDIEAARLTMQGTVATARSIEEVLARLNQELTGLSRLFTGLEGMDAPIQTAISAIQRCRLKYRNHLQDFLVRLRVDQHQPTLPVFVLPDNSQVIPDRGHGNE
jgi:hypothetical protein